MPRSRSRAGRRENPERSLHAVPRCPSRVDRFDRASARSPPTGRPGGALVMFDPDTPAARTPLYKSLYLQVLVAVAAGACVGLAAPSFAEDLKVLSESFINLIKMMIGPVVFCTIVLGIAGAGSLRRVGGVGVKALVVFQLFTGAALVIGLAVANIVRPGDGVNANLAAVDASSVS